MIRIQLNGQKKALEEALTINQLIRILQINTPHVAVAINYDVIPHSEFPTLKVKDGDKIDILQPTQGG